jgi:hypothetical protein
MNSLLKKPSAWIPIVVSMVVLAAMLIYMAIVGVPAPEPDEGVGAHLFQIWLFLEMLMVAFFAAKWLLRDPMRALLVLVLQVAFMLLPISIVFFLKL